MAELRVPVAMRPASAITNSGRELKVRGVVTTPVGVSVSTTEEPCALMTTTRPPVREL